MGYQMGNIECHNCGSEVFIVFHEAVEPKTYGPPENHDPGSECGFTPDQCPWCEYEFSTEEVKAEFE
jgi:hypothetical protein